MPYKSDAQARLMRAVAHSPEFAKKVGISQSVGRKFEEHKAEGGSMRAAALKKVFAGKETPAEERKEKTAAKKAGMSYKAAERKFEGEKYCGGGKTKGYADGGEPEGDSEETISSAPSPRYEPTTPDTTPLTFKEAFARARSDGDKTFTWKGKKYTTEMAPAKPKSPPAPTPKYEAKNVTKNAAYETPYDRMNRRNQEDAAASAAADAEADRMAKRKPFTPSKINMQGLDKDTLLPKYKTGGSVNPGLTPDEPDSLDQLERKRRAAPTPTPMPKPRRVNPGVSGDLPDSSDQLRGLKKGGSVRGVGIAKRGFGCGGRVK